jgi:hypothetical protein
METKDRQSNLKQTLVNFVCYISHADSILAYYSGLSFATKGDLRHGAIASFLDNQTETRT